MMGRKWEERKGEKRSKVGGEQIGRVVKGGVVGRQIRIQREIGRRRQVGWMIDVESRRYGLELYQYWSGQYVVIGCIGCGVIEFLFSYGLRSLVLFFKIFGFVGFFRYNDIFFFYEFMVGVCVLWLFRYFRGSMNFLIWSFGVIKIILIYL